MCIVFIQYVEKCRGSKIKHGGDPKTVSVCTGSCNHCSVERGGGYGGVARIRGWRWVNRLMKLLGHNANE